MTELKTHLYWRIAEGLESVCSYQGVTPLGTLDPPYIRTLILVLDNMTQLSLLSVTCETCKDVHERLMEMI